ncbi:uncharacterized protein LOC116344317 [Contarinia nasturtii]|uniref:uncharacterized protein LOC116344317 n=1 Tax=Contarinia nasturtii TaxID=265458 RepID=UPI0012D46494|nr:uncharacterized protein LOC116344317 [Contarinia nasturtii]
MAICVIIGAVLLQFFVCEIATLPVSSNDEILPEVTSEPSTFFRAKSSATVGIAAEKTTGDSGSFFSKLRTLSGSIAQTEPSHGTNFESTTSTISVTAEKPDNFHTLAIGKSATESIDIDVENHKRTSTEIDEGVIISSSNEENENMIGLARAFGLLGKTLMLVPLIVG